jgi:peptidoglycan hydrolase CwlO-like protein
MIKTTQNNKLKISARTEAAKELRTLHTSEAEEDPRAQSLEGNIKERTKIVAGAQARLAAVKAGMKWLVSGE